MLTSDGVLLLVLLAHCPMLASAEEDQTTTDLFAPQPVRLPFQLVTQIYRRQDAELWSPSRVP